MTKNTRREFLVATAGVGVWSVSGLAQARSPSDKLNLGFIGVTGRGGQNMDEMTGENVAALCDVDERHLGKAAEKFPKARQYRDFRKMIDEAMDLDALVISTPHHVHAPATARALAAGKHVYCEKPLTHTVWEARVVIERSVGERLRDRVPALTDRANLCRPVGPEAAWRERRACDLQLPAFAVVLPNEAVSLGAILGLEVCGVPLTGFSK